MRKLWAVMGVMCLSVAGMLGPSTAVNAQFAMCGERQQIVDQLKTKYQETRQAVGLISTNGAAELYVSEKGTWTMLVTVESGKSCIIAAGHSWEKGPPTPVGQVM